MFYPSSKFFRAAAGFFILLTLLVPVYETHAAATDWGGLVITCTGQPLIASQPNGEKECTINDLVNLIVTITNYLVGFSLILATIAFMWIGVVMLTAQGDPGKITRAKQIAWNVMIGFLFVLCAWLIVYTITRVLKADFSLFMK